jgi:hypothetical protein
MMDDLERRLRESFAQTAMLAPSAVDLASAARARALAQRRVGAVAGSLAVATVLITGVWGSGTLTSDSRSSEVASGQVGRGSPAASSPSAAETATPAGCRVTEPTRSGIPSEVAKQAFGNVFGNGRLWVGAWWTGGLLDQVRSKDLADDQFPYTAKYATWTLQDGKVSAAAGAPQVSVKRLDAPGHGEGSFGGYATTTEGFHFWPTGVGFSDTGCWQVTETVGGDSVTYIVQI